MAPVFLANTVYIYRYIKCNYIIKVQFVSCRLESAFRGQDRGSGQLHYISQLGSVQISYHSQTGGGGWLRE